VAFDPRGNIIPDEARQTIYDSLQKSVCQDSLYDFLEAAWPAFDPSPFVGGWHLKAIAEHLEAVSYGQIKRLLINIRPRSSKTSIVAIAYPVWTWAQEMDPDYPLLGPGVRFLCASYSASKAQEDAVTARRLIASNWYQNLWGDRVRIAPDRDNAERYDTINGGSRISTGIPESLGKGGMIKIIDDPTKPDEVESEKVSQQTVRNYKEIWQTRGNDPMNAAEIMVMQRQAEGDLSGYWLENHDDTVHFCIPTWHEEDRVCRTFIDMAGKIYSNPPQGMDVKLFWEDPREEEGENFWPGRYPRNQRLIDEALGPYAFSGQIQQRPEPRGGGILKRVWWQVWPPDDAIEQWTTPQGQRFPDWELQVAYLDTAFTKNSQNDYCALTAWGVFANDKGTPCCMMRGAWHDHLSFQELLTKLADTLKKWRIDFLIIENKAGGNWVRDELIKQLDRGDTQIVLDTPAVDKVSRAHAVVPMFTGKLVYAPFLHDTNSWRAWAEMVITECEKFPAAKNDDLCLSAGTLIATKRGLVPIEAVVIGDSVITPVGWCDVTASGMTGMSPVIERCGLRGTSNHPVYSLDGGFVRLDTVTGDTRLGHLTLCGLIRTTRRKRLSSTGSHIGGWEGSVDTTSPNRQQTEEGSERRDCTSQSGSMPMALRFHQAMMSTTETLTHLISALIIWSAYRRANIAACLRTWIWKPSVSTLSAFARSQSLGTSLTPVENGTREMPPFLSVLQGRQKLLRLLSLGEFAFGVGRVFYAAAAGGLRALIRASRNTSHTSKASESSQATTIVEPVYNLTVERANCYYANGVLVHNCDTVTGALGYLRRNGLIKLQPEAEEEDREAKRFKGNPDSIAEWYGVT
jgi:predicted phage terminase large subunit-like protein